MLGKTCKLEQLQQIVDTSTRAPGSQLCHYQPDPDNPYKICGVIADVINGQPVVTDAGDDRCYIGMPVQTSPQAIAGALRPKENKSPNADFLARAYGITGGEEPEPKKSVPQALGGIIKKIIRRPD